MKKVFLIIIMSIFLTSLISCQSKVKFKVIEQKSYVITRSTHENINDSIIDGEEVIIYKTLDQMNEDLNNKGFIINVDSFSEQYNDEYFEQKALVIFYGYDSRGGLDYNFKSITIDNNELVLNLVIVARGYGADVLVNRLFTIEIKKEDVKEFNKLKCEIKEVDK